MREMAHLAPKDLRRHYLCSADVPPGVAVCSRSCGEDSGCQRGEEESAAAPEPRGGGLICNLPASNLEENIKVAIKVDTQYFNT